MAATPNLVGKRFGELVVVARVGSDPRGKARWHVRCDCGEGTFADTNSLRSGTKTSCGCKVGRAAAERNARTHHGSMVGQQFGRLTVMERRGSDRNQKALWLAECACGARVTKTTGQLRSGHTRSCGCLRSETAKRTFTKHGLTAGRRASPEIATWSAMIRRCHDPRESHYPWYGARGIKVCARWRASFGAFLADMGIRPGPGFTLDRIDNDGDYTPENCRWATSAEQSRNRSDNHWIEIDGERRTLVDWARARGLKYQTIVKRIERGWSERDAVLTPLAS